jgi:hypothetical protein
VNATPTIRQAAPNDRARIKEIVILSFFLRFFRLFAAHSLSNQADPIFVSEQKVSWSGEQDLNLRRLGICGLSRLE